MAEIAERAELYQPTFEQAKDLVAEMGESPAERIDWLMRQQPDAAQSGPPNRSIQVDR